MSASPIYLDNNATTRPAPEVVDAVAEMMREQWGNPSSVHRLGQTARYRIESARAQVAALVGASEREVVFTSGGTESANLAITGLLGARPERRVQRRVLVTSRLEHSAVRELAEALVERKLAEVHWLEHRADGTVDLDALDALLTARGAEIAVVSIMWANNETGVVQPVAEIGERCRAARVPFHTDATQAVGRIPVDLASLPIDLATFSAHKFHGPKGVGALYLRRGMRPLRQLIGGPQERELRGGTENVPGIVGMGVAATLAQMWLATDERDRLTALRDRFERSIVERVPNAVVNGATAPRLWNTTNVGFPRLEAEAILLLLSERGVCASAGAACSSGSLDPSPVLLAMGVPPDVAHGSIRLSLSRETNESEIDAAIDIVTDAVTRLGRTLPQGV